MSHLLEQVSQSIQARNLLRRGQRVLIAVSGGVDSMALLHVLHGLSHENAWRLAVAHLNHRLRGRSSDADERLVIRAAKQLGLPVAAERADVRKFALTHKLSLEMAARKVRHDFLARTAARLQIRSVALAHHADDQLELFFLRLLRGSGAEGLAGMKWRTQSPSDPKIELVRPLLDQPKSALREFAGEKKIGFREDASNARLEIQRNRIRHELLPLLRRNYQPALDRIILRLMNVVGAEAEVVSESAEQWLGQKNRTPFNKLPVAVQRRCLQLQLRSRGAELWRREIIGDYDLVERLRTTPEQPFTLLPQLSVVRDASGQLHWQELKPTKPNLNRLEVVLAESAKEIVFGNVKLGWRIDSRRPFPLPKPRAGREFFDADKVGSRIVLRHWQPGDRFQPIGMASPVKLQDLFTDRKISRERRHDLLVAATIGGKVFWVENLRMSERFKLTKDTNRRLQWQWKRL